MTSLSVWSARIGLKQQLGSGFSTSVQGWLLPLEIYRRVTVARKCSRSRIRKSGAA